MAKRAVGLVLYVLLAGCSGSDPGPGGNVDFDAGSSGDVGGSSCAGRMCGANGAGGSCGSCGSGFTCNAAGQCIETNPVATCRSECGARQCGADPGLNCSGRFCGTNGGACPTGTACMLGQCVCTPNCAGRTCGPDGCGGTCAPGCGRGFQCGGAGTCDIDPSSRWVLTVTTGTVATQGAAGAWDPFGGAPDPQVCITISGRTTCTPYANDTFTASWNFAFPETTAGVLQAGVMTSYVDYDSGTANDRICGDYTLAINRATFLAGGTTVGCGSSGWNFTLRAQ